MPGLCSVFRNVLKLDLESNQAIEVARSTVNYLCGVSGAYEYQRQLKQTVNFSLLDLSAKDFRLLLIEKSYFTLNSKFFVLALCKVKMSLENIHRYATAFDMDRNDVVLMRRTITPKFRKSLRSSKRVSELSLADLPEDVVVRTQRKFNSMYPELIKHIKHKTFNKLRFLVHTENAEFADFNGELLYKAIKTYYMMVPTNLPEAHVVNYLRKSCTHHALNIIEAKTSSKRRRLHNVGSDGFGGSTFSLACVSENQLAKMDGEDVFSYESTLNSDNENDTLRLISEINFDRVVRNFGHSPTRRRAILIVSGQDDSRFTRYLRSREVIQPDEDCTDFVHRNKHDTVVHKLADHLGVSDKRLQKFLKKVGSELIKHRSVA